MKARRKYPLTFELCARVGRRRMQINPIETTHYESNFTETVEYKSCWVRPSIRLTTSFLASFAESSQLQSAIKLKGVQVTTKVLSMSDSSDSSDDEQMEQFFQVNTTRQRHVHFCQLYALVSHQQS